MQEKVVEAKGYYDKVRKLVRIPNDVAYQREGIENLAKPFVDGVFTLAIIGPMSAGKSSFINALLEDEDLLPTGHFQTTCTLTELVYSNSKKMRVEFGDGHVQSYEGDTILGKIKEVAAIPQKYKDLPINHINQLILEGASLESIWELKDDLAAVAGGIQLDYDLLEEYYNSKSPANIPIHVWVEYPLSDSYKGWRIVDTPGIGAIGGIDKKTKDFLATENVDAAVFLFNGSKEIDNKEITEVVSPSYSQLTDIAKERTFFVITRGGESECQIYIKSTMDKAKKLFSEGDNVHIPADRFFVVDSMLSLLYDCAIKTSNLDPAIFLANIKENYSLFNVDISDNSDAANEEKAKIQSIRRMISFMRDNMEENDIEINSENLNKKILESSGFVILKKELGEFAKQSKKEAYNKIRERIIEDFEAFGSKKNEDISLLTSKLTKSPEEFRAELEAKLEEVEGFRRHLMSCYGELMISYGSAKLVPRFNDTKKIVFTSIDTAQYYYQIESSLDNYAALTKKDQHIIVQEFITECERLTRKNVPTQFRTVVLPPIDFDGAVSRAKVKATKTESYQVTVRKEGFWEGVKYYVGFGWCGTDAGQKKETRYRDVVDEGKKFSETKINVKTEIENSIQSLCGTITKEYINPTGRDIQNQLNALVEKKREEYSTLEQQMVSENELRDQITLLESEKTSLNDYITEVNNIMAL